MPIPTFDAKAQKPELFTVLNNYDSSTLPVMTVSSEGAVNSHVGKFSSDVSLELGAHTSKDQPIIFMNGDKMLAYIDNEGVYHKGTDLDAPPKAQMVVGAAPVNQPFAPHTAVELSGLIVSAWMVFMLVLMLSNKLGRRLLVKFMAWASLAPLRAYRKWMFKRVLGMEHQDALIDDFKREMNKTVEQVEKASSVKLNLDRITDFDAQGNEVLERDRRGRPEVIRAPGGGTIRIQEW